MKEESVAEGSKCLAHTLDGCAIDCLLVRMGLLSSRGKIKNPCLPSLQHQVMGQCSNDSVSFLGRARRCDTVCKLLPFAIYMQ